MSGVLRRWGLVLSVLLVSCGGGSITVPEGMEPMAPFRGQTAKRLCPEGQGALFRFAGAPAGSPGYGVRLTQSPSENLSLLGVGRENGWIRNFPVEREGVVVSSVEALGAWVGDYRHDGFADLLFHLKVSSTNEAGTLKQEREALYLFRIGHTVQLVWNATLRLIAVEQVGCSERKLDFVGTPSFVMKDGLLEGIEVRRQVRRTECEGCAKKVCTSQKDERLRQWVWEEETLVFRDPGNPNAVLQVPDISL